MKYLFAFTVFWLFSFKTLFAQSSQSIEADLLKSFKLIGYWNRQSANTTVAWTDSLEKANNRFGEKLKSYTSKYPITIKMQYRSFPKNSLTVISAEDSLFRIYSWDTELGGTMHDFRNVIQYKTGKRTNSILVLETSSTNNDNYVPYYSKVYTLKTGTKTYYIAIYHGIYSSHDLGEGVKIYSVKNSALNFNTNIIRTKTGFHSKVEYSYDFFKSPNNHEIKYNSDKKILYIPIVTKDGKVTEKSIVYKFTGQYFERLK